MNALLLFAAMAWIFIPAAYCCAVPCQADGEADSVHGDTDLLWCCKFAEGDSRILLQKIARDRLKKLQKDGLAGLVAGVFDEETRVAFSLARTLQAAPDKAAAWNEQWADIYKLADLVCARHLASAAPPAGFDAPGFQEPLVDRYQDRSERGQL